jgi:hypothetical protein
MNKFTFALNGGEVNGTVRTEGDSTNAKYISDMLPETLYVDITDSQDRRIMFSAFFIEDNESVKGKDSIYAVDAINIPKNLYGVAALKSIGIETNIPLGSNFSKENIYDIFSRIMEKNSLVI